MTTTDSGPVDPTIQRVIDSLLASGVIASCDHQSTLPSTNSTALDWLNTYRGSERVDAIDTQLPRLVIADSQTAGRGRLGRSWQAQQDGLACSLVLSGCEELLSIAVGVAIAEAIEHLAAPLRCRLKWPNDVWINGKKVAGTLIERVDLPSQDRDRSLVAVVIGIGLNVGSSPKLSESETTSVCEATGKWITRSAVLSELIPMVIESVQRCQSDRDECLDAFRRRCVLTGEMIRCSIDGQVLLGRCEGLNLNGELRIRTESGERVCRSGEVSRVRISTTFIAPPNP
jgi:BirA family biotin operon repressor/biotin-[acetyl-CoA-carboxylase] ligase